MKKLALYGAVLIGIYLAVDHATGSGAVINAGSNAGDGIVKNLQGR